MKRYLKSISVFIFFIFLLADIHAQAKPAKKKEKKQESVEEPPPPPPPPPFMKEVILTDSTNFSHFSDGPADFDTTAVPEDQLTTRIREFMQLNKQMELAGMMIRKVYDSEDMKKVLPEDYRTKFIKAYEPGGIANKYLELINIRVYRKHFSISEVEEFIKFYKSPAGQKMVQVNPAILSEASDEGMKVGKWLGALLAIQND